MLAKFSETAKWNKGEPDGERRKTNGIGGYVLDCCRVVYMYPTLLVSVVTHRCSPVVYPRASITTGKSRGFGTFKFLRRHSLARPDLSAEHRRNLNTSIISNVQCVAAVELLQPVAAP